MCARKPPLKSGTVLKAQELQVEKGSFQAV
jgi:hypothetical protein